MAANRYVYISHDNAERRRSIEGLIKSLINDETIINLITFGHGDANPEALQWNPVDYGLAIFILSGPPTDDRWVNEGYRIQSELQRLKRSLQYPGLEILPNILMFAQKGIEPWISNRQIYSEYGGNITLINNIWKMGNWIEYEDDRELARLLRQEIGFFNHNTTSLLSEKMVPGELHWKGQFKVGLEPDG